MDKYNIRLNTYTDVAKFVNIVSKLDGKIVVRDDDKHCVNGKSVMGMLYALEFDKLVVESEKPIYHAIREFVIDE